MAGNLNHSSSVLFFSSVFLLFITTATASSRKLNALVQENSLVVLKYHNGPLLKGNYSVNVIMYGTFADTQRNILLDFISSLAVSSSSDDQKPKSVASWWETTESYGGGSSTNFTLMEIFAIDNLSSSEKRVKSSRLIKIANLIPGDAKSINVVLTGADVVVEGFCTSKCGTHGPLKKSAGSFVWVGNSASQCPGQCAWPFHQPIYGPQTPPLVAPNGDVGVDGMVINLATLLAGTVTNPYGTGYFQGPKDAPLEAVSACTGIFGKGAYPGYPGQVLVDEATGASYNANGINGRKYLLPAMWDPKTSRCATLV